MSIQHHRVHGDTIGNFLGEPIYQSIQEDGKNYIFDRIADGDDEGYSLFQLRKDEILVNPGLIYRASN